MAQSFKSFFKPKTTEAKPADESSTGNKEGPGGGATTSAGLDGQSSGGAPHEFLNQFRVKKDMRLAPVARADPLTDDRKSRLDVTLEAAFAVVPVADLYLGQLKGGSHTPLSTGRTWKVEGRGTDDDDDVQILDEEDEDAPLTVPGCSVEIDIADMEEDNKKKRTCQSRAKLLQVNYDINGFIGPFSPQPN